MKEITLDVTGYYDSNEQKYLTDWHTDEASQFLDKTNCPDKIRQSINGEGNYYKLIFNEYEKPWNLCCLHSFKEVKKETVYLWDEKGTTMYTINGLKGSVKNYAFIFMIYQLKWIKRVSTGKSITRNTTQRTAIQSLSVREKD